MNSAWKVFFSLSISGSLLILPLLLGRPLLKNRLSRRWQYYVWLIVIARLLLPLSPETSLMGTLFRQTEPAPAAAVPLEENLPPALPEEPAEYTALPPESTGAPGGEPGTALRQNLGAIWLAVAALLLLRKITVYQSFGQYMRAGCSEISDIARLERLAETSAALGVKRPVELYENRLASSPMLLGFFRPCIILPDAGLPDMDFQYTLRHELTHYRRLDLAYKWLVQLTVCLHWFNPLVWLMGREINRACELSCDEAVIRSLSPPDRRAYGDMLLRATAAGGNCRSSAGSVTLHESGKLLKERLGAIMNFKKTSKAAAVCSLLLASLLLMGAAAAGAYTNSLPSAAVPNAVKGDPSAAFRYTQQSYYEAPYRFDIGWNVRENAKNMYWNTQLALNDGSTMTVLFTDSCKDSLKDGGVRRALSALLGQLKAEAAKTDAPLLRPLVTGVNNVGNSSTADLAEQCYQEGDIAGFSTAFIMLDEAAQRKYLNMCYEDGSISYFGACMNCLPQDSPLFAELAERAYADGNIAFFSIPANRLSKSDVEAWAIRAREDNRFAFFAMLANASGTEWAQKDVDKIKEEREKQLLEEYRAYGITKNGWDYYYQGKLARIFVDLQAGESFITLNTNPKGTVDIKVTRNTNGSIQSVGYLPENEKKELFGDSFGEDSQAEPDDVQDSPSIADSVVNLSKEELPEAARRAIQNCSAKAWYLIHAGERQYVYCSGFGWSFGYRPALKDGRWTVDIVQFQRKDGGYVLLSLPDGSPVSVTCSGETVKLAEIK